MARIRTVKPELWNDPQFVACSPLARLLFIGTWNIADDYGVLKDDPERLHLQLLPKDIVDAHELVDELVKRDLLLRRLAPDGTKVLVIRTFCIHQKIDKRAVGRYGDPADFQPIPTDPAESPPIPPTSTPVKERKGLERKGLERNGSLTPLSSSEHVPGNELELITTSPTATASPVRVVFDAWRESTGKKRAEFSTDRKKIITKALNTYPVDDLVDAVRGWRHSRHHRGENDSHTVYNDLGLLLRHAANIEKFRDLERGAASEQAVMATPRSFDAIDVLTRQP